MDWPCNHINFIRVLSIWFITLLTNRLAHHSTPPQISILYDSFNF